MQDLTYNVLWFEDNDSYVDTTRPLLEDDLKKYGLELKYCREKSFKTEMNDTLLNKRWDLVLIDYKLQESSIKGDELILNLRENGFYTDVIFYSDNTNFSELIKENLFEGVYFAYGRSELFGKFKKIVDNTLKRSHTVLYQRGAFISHVIELADIMDEIISVSMKLNGNDKVFFKDEILGREFFSDYNKWITIKKLLKNEIKLFDEGAVKVSEKDKANVESYIKSLAGYDDVILKKRNKLAHCKMDPENQHCIITSSMETISFGPDECKENREALKKYYNILTEIKEYFNLAISKRSE